MTKLDGFDSSNEEGLSFISNYFCETREIIFERWPFFTPFGSISRLSKSRNCLGETPLFYAVKSNQQICMHELLKAGGNIFILVRRNLIINTAAKFNNFAAIDENLAQRKTKCLMLIWQMKKSYVFLYLKYHFLISLIYLLSFVLKFLIAILKFTTNINYNVFNYNGQNIK
ncbi:hypothetical protein Avbf_17895 [Armadillidium vulgare]|nr:hypothetical protein Avbf_17895 [Armadillidium vulgare]